MALGSDGFAGSVFFGIIDVLVVVVVDKTGSVKLASCVTSNELVEFPGLPTQALIPNALYHHIPNVKAPNIILTKISSK